VANATRKFVSSDGTQIGCDLGPLDVISFPPGAIRPIYPPSIGGHLKFP
jgi:hypothetical protein